MVFIHFAQVTVHLLFERATQFERSIVALSESYISKYIPSEYFTKLTYIIQVQKFMKLYLHIVKFRFDVMHEFV